MQSVLFSFLVPQVVNKLSDDLRADYKVTRRRPQEEEWPPEQPTSIVSVALIHYINRRTQQELIEISERFKEGASAVDKLVASSHSKVTKNIDKIFAPDTNTSEPPKRILIEGAPGIGKTVLAKEIVYLWANDELLKDHKLVFLVHLRDPKLRKVISVKDFLKIFTIKEVSQELEEYVEKSRGENVVFIFDGFDELPDELQRDSFVTSIIKGTDVGKRFRQSIVVVTSRPKATLLLHNQVDRRIEILGFAKEERDKYISLYLKDTPDKKQELDKYLKQHPIINDLCFIPLHLTILLFLFKEESLPETLTEMNEFFVTHTIYRHLNKVTSSDKLVMTKLKDLPENIYKFVKKLSKLAFVGLQNNQLVFSYNEIKKLCPKIDKFPGTINGLGLLQAVSHYVKGGVGRTTSVNFLHFTMQEYLAAFHVSTLPCDQQSSLMKRTFWDGRFNFMWMMFVGIVGIRSNVFTSFISKHDTGGTIIPGNDVLSYHSRYVELSHAIQNDKRKCLHLFQCYMEAKSDGIPHAISTIFSDGNIKLTGIALLPHHISSLVFFMSVSTTLNWRILELKNCNLGNNGMNSLSEHLKKNEENASTLEYVDLSGNNSSPWSVYCIVIRHCCAHNLTLCGDDGIEEYINDIIESLGKNAKLTSLTLCNIGRSGVNSIKEVIVNNTTLQEVNISWKKLKREDTKDKTHIFMHTKLDTSAMTSNNHKLMDINVLYDEYCEPMSNKINLSKKRINDDIVSIIAFALHNNVIVERLDLSRNSISYEGAAAIANCFQENHTLIQLDLSLNMMTSSGMNSFVESAINTSALEYVDLSGNESSPWGAYCAIIRHSCVLSSLTVCGEFGMEDHVREIIDSLEANVILASLTLYNIGRAGIESIKAILSCNTTLSKVNVSWKKIKGEINDNNVLLHTRKTYNDRVVDVNILHDGHHEYLPRVVEIANTIINDNAAVIVAFGLHNNTTVQKLKVSCSQMSDVVAISDGLKYNSTLLELIVLLPMTSKYPWKRLGLSLNRDEMLWNMAGQRIGDAGAIIVSAMLSNKVTKLDLSFDSICDDGVISISNCLKSNCTLQELNLSRNDITDEGAKKLAESLKINKVLQTLDISFNNISNNGAIAIGDHLKDNVTLKELDLSNNMITCEGAKMVCHALQLSTKFKKLNITKQFTLLNTYV